MAISLIGLIVRTQVLRTGFIVDDYAQLSMMNETYPVSRSPLGLFTFSDGSLADNQALKDAGFFPWWSDQKLKIALFRPLASALMWFDRAAFGDSSWLYHVHNAAWWLCMSVAWGVVVRHFLPAAGALLVHVLCVAHPANSMLLGWVANRNASVAMFFGLLALWLQVRRRNDVGRVRLQQYLIPVCWGLSLLAGEYGMSILAYCFAFELGRSDNLKSNLLRLRPCLAVVLGYALMRIAWQFGSRGSGMYIDPLGEPWAFLRAAALRGPVLAGDLVLGLRSNWWSAGYPWAEPLRQAFNLGSEWSLDLRPMRQLHLIVGWVACATGVCLIWLCQRKSSSLWFAAVALPLSMLPTLAGTPESRILPAPLFGWTLLLTQALLLLRSERRQSLGARVSTLIVSGLAVAELVASIHYSREDRQFLPQVADMVRTSILAPELDRDLSEVQDAFLVSAVDPTTTIYIPMLRRWHDKVGPARCHLLMSTVSEIRLDRLGSNEFRLTRQQLFYTPPDVYAEAFRREPVFVGQVLFTQWLRAIVEQVHDGMPTTVRFQSALSLDGPNTVLLIQGADGLRARRFPPPGESVMIPPANLPFELAR